MFISVAACRFSVRSERILTGLYAALRLKGRKVSEVGEAPSLYFIVQDWRWRETWGRIACEKTLVLPVVLSGKVTVINPGPAQTKKCYLNFNHLSLFRGSRCWRNGKTPSSTQIFVKSLQKNQLKNKSSGKNGSKEGVMWVYTVGWTPRLYLGRFSLDQWSVWSIVFGVKWTRLTHCAGP